MFFVPVGTLPRLRRMLLWPFRHALTQLEGCTGSRENNDSPCCHSVWWAVQLSRVVLFRSFRKQALRSWLAGRSEGVVSWLAPRKRVLNLFSNEDLLEKSHSKYQARHQAVLWSHCPQISETVCIGHFVIYTGNHSFLAETEEVKWDLLTSLGVLLSWGPCSACRCW